MEAGANIASAEQLKALDASIRELEAQEQVISLRRRKLHERLAVFPSAHGDEQEREISSQRRDLHREIDRLKVERNLLRDQAPGTR
jgi:hypothetical protein